jgi:CO/xanthine dehydrogenase FAD-binding subunit
LSVTTIENIVQPETIEEALAALGDGARPIGGGTDVMLHAPPGTTTLVDLAALGLADIEETPNGFAIGAMATLTDMEEHPALRAHLGGILPEMLVHVGSPLLRNVATIGGHLARGRLSDVVPALIAIDTAIQWYDGEAREGLLADYYAEGVHSTPMLITGILIPPAPEGAAAAFLKFSRTFYDLALINSACRLTLDAGTISDARVVVGETPALGGRARDAEAALVGGAPSAEAFKEAAAIARTEVATRADSRASAEYRSQLVGVAVERCLGKVAARLEVTS